MTVTAQMLIFQNLIWRISRSIFNANLLYYSISYSIYTYKPHVNKLQVAAGVLRLLVGLIARDHPACLSSPYRSLSTLSHTHEGTRRGLHGMPVPGRKGGRFHSCRYPAEEELSRSLRYLRRRTCVCIEAKSSHESRKRYRGLGWKPSEKEREWEESRRQRRSMF